MVLNHFSSPPSALSLGDALKTINKQLENAQKPNDPTKRFQLCKDAESNLKVAEKIFAAERVGHPTQDNGIANAYHEHAVLLDDLRYHDKANKSHIKAKDWGYVHTTSQQTESSRPNNTLGSTAATPEKMFREDVALPLTKYTLPEDISRITSTPQLAYCLSLSLPSLISKEELSETDYEWSQAKVNDPDEQERLQSMATDVIREFIRDELKKSDAVAEVVSLAAVLDKDDFRKLLQVFVDGIDQSVLLKLHLIDGLAHLIRNAAPGCVDADDLVKILEMLNMRLKGTHQQSTEHVYRLTQTVSRVLDSMVDSQVKDLKREKLHEPLSAYLKDLQASSDHFLVYQAVYAYQALQYIPDDETILQATLRRTGKVAQGVSGVVSAVKALDLNGFIQGLQDIHGGSADSGDAVTLIKDTYQGMKDLAESGQNFIETIKEDLSLSRKRAWYPALRGLDLLLREGRLIEFENLIQQAPCRQDPWFQLGVCQRLGEVAANTYWDSNVRQCAISFLGEMYKDDNTWSLQTNIKQWIAIILTQLSDSSDDTAAGRAGKQLQELGVDRSLLLVATKGYPSPFAMSTFLTPQTSSLLDRVLNKPDVEGALHQLRIDRLKERGRDIYISPRARASQASKEDFDLLSKTQEFLSSNKKVLLLLGDSGAGKSTFNRELEISLWDKYEKNGRIPIFIHLPTIDNPEHDLVDKQLYKANFTKNQIRELKTTREIILICDGYDESQQTRNLYMSNQLNRIGGWKAQMVIGCRTEYTGADYKDLFQPTDRNSGRDMGLMQEMVITPFNKDQIQDYINQYVSLRKTPWESKDYVQALKQIRSLQDLVKNPFLLKMALEVLPTMADKGSEFSHIRITRIELYDKFVGQWIERSKIRFGEIDLSYQDQENFKMLSGSGFKQHGITYLKELSTAIYDNQSGNPIVKYSHHYDRKSWKEAFFSNINGGNLLKETIPLVRDGDIYRFLHKSVLEYGLTLAVFDPYVPAENTQLIPELTRRGSTSSILSFEAPESDEETAIAIKHPLLESPLGKRSLVNEPSIRQFLVERIQQQPVFQEQLHTIIELSKTDKAARIAAANSITVLVQAGVQFNGADLQGIKIPGADLSYGVFDSAQLQGADLRKTNLRNAWLREADLSGAQMASAQFGELPYLQEEGHVKICAYSPNGMTFAVGLVNGNISLYDTANWSRIQALEGHGGEITGFVYSPQGDQIASGSDDNTVRLWDVKSGNCIHVLQGHSEPVTSVAYSPRGDQIASGSDDSTIRLWDVKTGNCVKTLEEHSDWVKCVTYSPKGDQIASAGDDFTVRVWDVESGNCVYTLEGHTETVRSVVYSSQGDRIASGCYDDTIRLWDVETGNCVHILEGHDGYVKSIVFSPKGDQIASGSTDETIKVWDVGTGDCIHTLQGHSGDINCVVYSPKGDQIASGSLDETVRVWDIETGDCIYTLQGHSHYVWTVVYSPKGDRIASGSDDETVRLWDVESYNFAPILQGHSKIVRSVVYSPKSDHIASASNDKTVRLWNVETGSCVHTFQGHDDWVSCVTYSPRGDQIASGCDDFTIRLWDINTGDCVHTLHGHDDWVGCIMYSPTGHQITSGSNDGTARVWDVDTGECIHTLEGHTETVRNIVYSPNGDLIASGSLDKTVRLWDIETGNCVHVLQGHDGEVNCVVYSPKGGQVASGSDDETIRLWDIETSNAVHILKGHSGCVWSIAYSPKGDRIASGSDDETVRLWDVETGDCVHTLQGHSKPVMSTAYSPKGDLVASGSFDKTVRLWDVETGECVVFINSFEGEIESISWNYIVNDQYIATGSQDRSVRHWRIIRKGDGHKALLHWSSSHGVLTVYGASFKDVQGLSVMNWSLLHQHGVLNPSSIPLVQDSHI